MKKILKSLTTISFVMMFAVFMVACGSGTSEPDTGKIIPEKVTLATTTLSEVEFANADTVKLEQKNTDVTISGKIDAMSESQKSAFGVNDATHVVALKVSFDKERTLKTFELKGNVTKVYSSDSEVENYVGSLSDLLDNDGGDDSYCNLLLSAQTKNYTLKAIYTDGTTREMKINITATLATASAE